MTNPAFSDARNTAAWAISSGVDPGLHPGDFTTIAVTYYDVVGTDGQLAPFETFTLRRPRRD